MNNLTKNWTRMMLLITILLTALIAACGSEVPFCEEENPGSGGEECSVPTAWELMVQNRVVCEEVDYAEPSNKASFLVIFTDYQNEAVAEAIWDKTSPSAFLSENEGWHKIWQCPSVERQSAMLTIVNNDAASEIGNCAMPIPYNAYTESRIAIGKQNCEDRSSLDFSQVGNP